MKFCEFDESITCKHCGRKLGVMPKGRLRCPGRRDETELTVPLECVYRGNQLRTEKGERCGMRGLDMPVFWCSYIKDECVPRPYKSGPQPKSCSMCRHRETY